MNWLKYPRKYVMFCFIMYECERKGVSMSVLATLHSLCPQAPVIDLVRVCSA